MHVDLLEPSPRTRIIKTPGIDERAQVLEGDSPIEMLQRPFDDVLELRRG